MSRNSQFSGGSVALGRDGGTTTLVEQSSFSLSGDDGDIHEAGAEGFFADDTRVLSRLELRVGDKPLELLSVSQDAESRAAFVLRTRPQGGQADSRLMVIRRRTVEGALVEAVELRSYGREPVHVEVSLDIDVDFADIFAVKQGRTEGTGADIEIDGDELTFSRPGERPHHGAVTRVWVKAPHAKVTKHQVRWDVDLSTGKSWTGHLRVRPDRGKQTRERALMRRREQWRQRTPTLRTDDEALQITFDRSLRDLQTLRLFGQDPDGLPVVAAGAPWFMTLFGRDSLLTAYMTLLIDHELALGVLQTLARHQGTATDADSEEQPGRILHEVRYGWSSIYYGTADATPLFVVLLGECLRWGLPWELLELLLPHADRALEWVEHFGDRDGDGYVEYERMTPHGLRNQGWKDSADAIVFADGRRAEPPIALCEVQGYVYAAFRARAALARRAGDHDRADALDVRAQALAEHFNQDFWMPDRRCYALALDRDKNKVDAVASNMGHCLWTGIATPEHARDVARHLISPELFSGWGIRTLSTSMAAFNPMSYQRGSVWPHDTAISVAGLVRYGLGDEAAKIGLALLEAAREQGGRLPELFTGLARDELSQPVAYPTACSPQAWASAAPLLVLRSLLRLDVDVPAGRLAVDPIPLKGVDELVLDGVPIGTGRLQVTGDGETSLTGAEEPVLTPPQRECE
jgi:glycogen debranching enzyme